MKPDQEKVTLNIGGVRYQTYVDTLRTLPGTKLCRLTEPQAWSAFDYNPNAKEFFFDRNAILFEEVLNYYRTQHLHCPEAICKSVFEEELAFWEIHNVPLAPCCGQRLSPAEEQQGTLTLWDGEERQNEAQDLQVEGEGRSSSWRARWQPKIWSLFEKPHSSLRAKCLAAISFLFNIGIIVLFLWETRDSEHVATLSRSFKPDDKIEPHDYTLVEGLPYHFYLKLFCVLWFAVEFFIRFVFCPDRKKFLKNPLNVADFLSLFPIFIKLFSLGHVNKHLEHFLGFLSMAYIFKLLKTIKLVEPPLMFKILSYTSRCLLKEFFFLIVIFLFEMLFFGTLCYWSEFLVQDTPYIIFHDVPVSFWWAVITLTTVGYGDVVPLSLFSRVIGACTALCGVLTFTVPIPIFFIKFKGYYNAAIIREKIKRLKKQAPALTS